jgi:CDP-diacylglycerol--glycerol-3-phosphate 3-phosphatidyltransferase
VGPAPDPRAHGIYAGTAVFGLAVATDYLDGYLARRRNEVTRLGMLLDPIADKLLTAAASCRWSRWASCPHGW